MINLTPTDTTDEITEVLDEVELQDVKRKSVSGAFSYIVRTLFLNGLGIVTAMVLSGYFSPEDFGIYGYVTQFIGLLVFFSDIGLAASLIQKKVIPTLNDYRTVFTIQQSLSWLIFVITLLLSRTSLVAGQVGQAGVWVMLSLGISFPLASLKTVSSIRLERKLDFSKLVIPQIVEQLFFNAILIVLAFKGYGVIAYAYAIIVRSVVGAIVMFILEPWAIGLGFSKTSAKELLNFGAKFQINDLLARIKDNLFLIVVRQWLTPVQYGYLSWSKTYSMLPYNMTVQNVMAITFPTFSRLQHNKDALKKAIEKSLFFITLAIFPMVVGMSVFITPLTELVPRYAKWQPALLSFALMSLSIAFSAISSPLTNTLNAIGKISDTLKLMVMWTLLTWVLTPIAIWKFGFNGVAIAGFVIAFSSVMPIIYVKKYVQIKVIDSIYRQLIAAIGMGVVSMLGFSFWSRSWLWFTTGTLISMGTYTVILLLVGWTKLKTEVVSLLKR